MLPEFLDFGLGQPLAVYTNLYSAMDGTADGVQIIFQGERKNFFVPPWTRPTLTKDLAVHIAVWFRPVTAEMALAELRLKCRQTRYQDQHQALSFLGCLQNIVASSAIMLRNVLYLRK